MNENRRAERNWRQSEGNDRRMEGRRRGEWSSHMIYTCIQTEQRSVATWGRTEGRGASIRYIWKKEQETGERKRGMRFGQGESRRCMWG